MRTHHWREPALNAGAVLATCGALFIVCLVYGYWQLPVWRTMLAGPTLASDFSAAPQAFNNAYFPDSLPNYLPMQQWSVEGLEILSPAAPAPVQLTDLIALHNNTLPPEIDLVLPASAEKLYVRNQTTVVVPPDHVVIAIVIDDVGVHVENSQNLLATLPPEVTFAFLPYGEASVSLAQLARQLGHEIMVHLPMEPTTSADPGPNALRVDADYATLAQRVRANILPLLDIAVGVNNHMGSRFTADAPKMSWLLDQLAPAGLFFLDSYTTPNPASLYLRSRAGLPILQRDVFLDHEITPEFIASALQTLEHTAKRKGHAIAIGHPYPLTQEALAAWIPTLAEKKISLVPITYLLD